jgi:hypothetical protein
MRHRLEVTKLWLEYLELVDPVRAPKIRRLLNYEIDAAKTTPSRNHPRPASTPLLGGDADQISPFE